MIKIGQEASISKIFSSKEVVNFSLISMDENPIHLYNEYAENTRFGNRIVQGPYLNALIGGILGSHLPGEGTIYLSEETHFKKPVYIGESITAHVRVEHIRHDKNIITLKKWIEKENGEIAMEGKSIVKYYNEL